jgi:hypothetical protein
LSLFLRWRCTARIGHDRAVNQESLDRANAFLAAVAVKLPPGELVELSPAEIGREIGVSEPLAAARAMRALLARRRLEIVDGRYRLLDARPIEPGEREQVPRPKRKAVRRAATSPEPSPARGTPTYSDVGHEVVERLIELGKEVATLRAAARTSRDEAREAREAKDEAVRRAQALTARVRELEGRAEMAERNLRTLLAAARGAGREAPVGDTEMEAILGVLKADEQADEGGDERMPGRASEPG